MSERGAPNSTSPSGGVRHALRFLLQTRPGRLLLLLLVLRALKPLGVLPSVLPDLAGLGLLGFAVWGVVSLRTKLLWRIRRKLIISYILIGLVPTVLILSFFLLSAYLVFGQVSSYILSASLGRIEAEAAHAADLTLGEVIEARKERGDNLTGTEIRSILDSRLRPLRSRYPGVSGTYFEKLNGGQARRIRAGEVPNLPPGDKELPRWAHQEGYRGLLRQGGDYLLGAFAEPPPGERDLRVLVAMPLSSALAQIEQETGLDIEESFGAVASASEEGLKLNVTRSASTPSDSPYSLTWPALLEARQWRTGERDREQLGIFIYFSFLRVYDLIATSELELGRTLLVALGILAGLFLAIEVVAVFVGLLLARSITGSIHTLSQGTERIRRGDFDYKIKVASRDQLGELAESFNSMTASIRDLLRQSAEKERLEEELRIARQIQMSLLPKDRVNIPGLSVAALCLPATEVGGDYYDFIPLGDERLGLLIADVSGKGTSAALYMAELKGLVLSLSKIYDSPRKLLIEANQILATNLDSRSFITMVYAVVDAPQSRMTYARAGHNPILQLSANGGGTRVLAPEGLGLGLDRGRRFEQLLAEESVPLHSGDVFLFFTDGLSEAMNPRADLFGESRLREILERHPLLSAEELREKIIEEISAFVEGEDQHDDMTMVLLKVL